MVAAVSPRVLSIRPLSIPTGSTMARPSSRRVCGRLRCACVCSRTHPMAPLPVSPQSRYRQSHNTSDWQSSYVRMQKLDEFHGQASGTFACDEHLAGKMPSRGGPLMHTEFFIVNLGSIVFEAIHYPQAQSSVLLWSHCSHMKHCSASRETPSLVCPRTSTPLPIPLSTIGHPAHINAYPHTLTCTNLLYVAERAEKLAYNALPATITPDMWAHQYLQQSNEMNAVVSPDHIWTHDGPDATL